MTLRFALLNLSVLSFVQWLFIKLTSASPDVQPFLHGAFGIAASIYLLGVYVLRRQKASLMLRLVHLTIAGIVFYLVWSLGIVGATHLASNLATGFSKTKGALFYGTSGTQFFHFHEAAIFCLIAFLPVFVLNLVVNVMLRNWLFPKRTII
ncbi:MAG TPA: hypothetical protein V6D33_01615 [Cyanophyceae cyanobacterium]